MRLETLQLKNFRCFEDVTIGELGDLNFFGGLNWSGKSTLLDALSFGLTGTCRGAETGRRLEELRTQADGKYAKHKASVTLMLDGGPRFTRMEDDGPKSGLQKQIDALLGIPTSTVRACLYAGELLRLPMKEAQALVLDLLPSQLVDVPGDVSTLVAKHLALPPSKGATLPQLEQWHQMAYERRREVGRLIKGLGDIGQAPARPEFLRGGDDPRDARRQTSEQIASLRRQRDAALQAASDAANREQRHLDKLAEARDVLKEVTAQLANLMTPEAIAAKTLELLDEIARCEEVNKERQEKRSTLGRELANAEGARALGEERLKTLRGLGSECALCGTKISQAKRDKQEIEIKNAIAAADARVVKARQELEVVQAVKPLGELQRQMADLEGVEQRYTGLARRKKDLEDLVVKLTAPRPTAELAPPANYDERIQIGETRVAVLDGYIAQLVPFQRSTAELATAQKEHDELERLLEHTGPDGLRTQLQAGAGLDAFQGAIAADMQAMGFTVDLGPLLRLEDDVHVNGRPARLLSESEMRLFSMAFACAVAVWSKLGLVAIDGWDALDDRASAAAGAVLSAHADLQRFVFTTPRKGMDNFVAQGLSQPVDGPVRFFVVEGGTVARLHAEAA